MWIPNAHPRQTPPINLFIYAKNILGDSCVPGTVVGIRALN